MGTYPEAQRALRQELQAAFPGPGLPSSYEILDANIPYLDATVEESFRLAGTAKAGLRQALVDTEILGYPVPKGTEILMNFHLNRPPAPIDEERRSHSSQSAAARRDRGSLSASSGHELSYFEPRRWLRFDKKTGQSEFDPYVATSLPFGGGFRGCFGKSRIIPQWSLTRPSLFWVHAPRHWTWLTWENRSEACLSRVQNNDYASYLELRIHGSPS